MHFHYFIQNYINQMLIMCDNVNYIITGITGICIITGSKDCTMAIFMIKTKTIIIIII